MKKIYLALIPLLALPAVKGHGFGSATANDCTVAICGINDAVAAPDTAVHCTAPTALGATGVVCDAFTANWTNVGATNYRIDVALNASFTILVYSNLNAGSGTSFNITGLVGGTTYFYRVRSNAPCISANSNVISVTTTMPTTVSWIGGASNNWFSGMNWTCGVVPNASVNVLINNSTAPNHWPAIDAGTAACNNLTITTTVSGTATRLLVSGSTAVLNVNGNIHVDANTTSPGYTLIVQDGAKLNNTNPASTAHFGPTSPSPNNICRQLLVKDTDSQANFSQLNITTGRACTPFGTFYNITTFNPWGTCGGYPGVLISNGAELNVNGNLTIGLAPLPTPTAYEGILWIDQAMANITGNVNIYNQFTGTATRGIGLKNGATVDILGSVSLHTDGALIALENGSFASIGALNANTLWGWPSGGTVVNSILYVVGDVNLKKSCGVAVLGDAFFIIDGNLQLDTWATNWFIPENLFVRSETALQAFVDVNGILDVKDERRIALLENSSLSVNGVDGSGVSAYIRTNSSCTLRTKAEFYTNGHLNLGGPTDTCSRIVMNGWFLSEPTLDVGGNLNLLANSHLDASNNTVRPVVIVRGNWNRSQNNIPTGPNKRGFSRGNNSIVKFMGTAAQAINTPAADPIEKFRDLEINSYNGVTLNSTAKAEVFGGLWLTDGIFNTGAAGNYLWVRNNLPSAVTRTSGHVNGWLYRDVTTHANYYEFPVGKGGAAPASAHFRRLALKFNSISGFNRVDARFNAASSVNAGACPTIDGMTIASNTGSGGFWSVNPNSGTYTTNYDMRLYIGGMGTFTDNQFIAVSRGDGQTNCNHWTGGGSIPASNSPGRTVASGYAQRIGLTTFSEKAIAPAASPLPVELTDFNAVPQNDRVLLTWNTQQETNNAYFSVERSADNGTFGEIGRVKGAGTTAEPQSYRTYDLAPLPGTSYYRLKQTDFDGKFAYSHTVSVTFDEEGDKVVVYPNPVDGRTETHIRFVGSRERKSTFRLFDVAGRLVWEHATDERHGEAVIPAGTLGSGIYVLKTNLSGNAQKLVVN
jgi:hypothetical protein